MGILVRNHKFDFGYKPSLFGNLIFIVEERTKIYLLMCSGEKPQSDDITLLGIKYFHGSGETK